MSVELIKRGDMMAKKKKKVSTKDKGNVRKEVNGVIIIASGVLLIFSLFFSNGEFIGSVSKSIIFSLIGFMGYLLPFILIAYGIAMISAQDGFKNSRKKKIGIIVILINTLLFVQMLTIKDYYVPGEFFGSFKNIIDAKSRFHGGIIGLLIDIPFYNLFGSVGSFIIFAAVFIIAAIIIFDISLYTMGKNV